MSRTYEDKDILATTRPIVDFSSLPTRHLSLLICGVFIALALVYAAHVPPFESSDEAAHFIYIHTLLTDGELPVIASREQLLVEDDVVKRWSVESHQPPLYYLIGAILASPTQRRDITAYLRPNPLIFLRGIPQDNPNVWLHPPASSDTSSGDTRMAVWNVRLYSLTLSTLTLWFIYQTTWMAFTSRRLAWTAMLLIAFMPTYLNIGSSVNNDNLVTLLATVGVYWCMKTWRDGLRRYDPILIGLITAGIALTKITGLTLLGIVGLALMIGVMRQRYPASQAIRVFVVMLTMTTLLAGWWYARNFMVYGDLLASAATQTVWGRDFAVAGESGDVMAEISRVWRSFWAMVGHLHQPVYGAGWGYIYVTFISLVGLAGLGWWRRVTREGSELVNIAFFAFIILLQLILLVYGTLSVDISYGRLLFPVLVAFAPLMAYGWTRLFRRMAPLLVLPLAIYTLIFPLTTLRDAYPQAQPIAQVPADAIPINARLIEGERDGDSLTLLAYRPETLTTAPDGALRFTLYLSQSDSRNPALFVTVLDSITLDSLGTRAAYPSMLPTDALIPNQIYAVPLWVNVHDDSDVRSPRQLKLQLGWQTALEPTYLPLSVDGQPQPQDTVILDSALLLDPRYQPPAPQVNTSVRFGEAIMLEGYMLASPSVRVNEPLMLTLNWRTLRPPTQDGEWVATVQVLTMDWATLITQDDGEIVGYPSASWHNNVQLADIRTLTIPSDTPTGRYQVVVGWYRLSDFQRLTVNAISSRDNLYPLATLDVIR